MQLFRPLSATWLQQCFGWATGMPAELADPRMPGLAESREGNVPPACLQSPRDGSRMLVFQFASLDTHAYILYDGTLSGCRILLHSWRTLIRRS